MARIYTDGAAWGSRAAGIGLFIEADAASPYYHAAMEIAESVGAVGSSAAELLAIQRAVEIVAVVRHPATILTDSEESLRYFTSAIPRREDLRPIVSRIGEALRSLGELVKLQHVKGHSGVPGNEAAHVLARRGLLLGDVFASSWRHPPTVEEARAEARQLRARVLQLERLSPKYRRGDFRGQLVRQELQVALRRKRFVESWLAENRKTGREMAVEKIVVVDLAPDNEAYTKASTLFRSCSRSVLTTSLQWAFLCRAAWLLKQDPAWSIERKQVMKVLKLFRERLSGDVVDVAPSTRAACEALLSACPLREVIRALWCVAKEHRDQPLAGLFEAAWELEGWE